MNFKDEKKKKMMTATQTAINFEVGHLEILTGTIPLLSNELLYTPGVIIVPEASVCKLAGMGTIAPWHFSSCPPSLINGFGSCLQIVSTESRNVIGQSHSPLSSHLYVHPLESQQPGTGQQAQQHT